jgi:hypothetical protein
VLLHDGATTNKKVLATTVCTQFLLGYRISANFILTTHLAERDYHAGLHVQSGEIIF